MQRSVAEAIAQKNSALKHCNKLIGYIDRTGSAEIKLGGTGVVLPCARGDALYTLLQMVRAQLVHEINSIEVVASGRLLSAPYGAAEPEPLNPEQTHKEASKPERTHKERVKPAPAQKARCSICKCCGAEFIKHHNRQIYCCDKCAAEGNYQLRNEAKKRREELKYGT